MTADNEAMRNQYNLMRRYIAQCLRELLVIAGIHDQQAAEAALAGTEDDLAQQDILADNTLDRLIREGTVTPQMATSLMNDSDAAVQISKRLIAIGEHLAAAQAQGPPAKDG
jgi:phosphate:Na+ symporter